MYFGQRFFVRMIDNDGRDLGGLTILTFGNVSDDLLDKTHNPD